MNTRMWRMVAGVGLLATLGVRADDALTIRGSDTFGEELGPKLIAAFQEADPGFTVELESLGSVSGIAALLDDACDIAVSSRRFNDDEQRIADTMVPALSTVALPQRAMGEQAMRSVLGRLGVGVDGAAPDQGMLNLVPCHLVPRGSTGSVPA